MPKESLTEKEIKKIIQLEIKSCFEQLTTDVREIKQALLGNDYQKGGLVSIVQSHSEYRKKQNHRIGRKRNKSNRMVRRIIRKKGKRWKKRLGKIRRWY